MCVCFILWLLTFYCSVVDKSCRCSSSGEQRSWVPPDTRLHPSADQFVSQSATWLLFSALLWVALHLQCWLYLSVVLKMQGLGLWAILPFILPRRQKETSSAIVGQAATLWLQITLKQWNFPWEVVWVGMHASSLCVSTHPGGWWDYQCLPAAVCYSILWYRKLRAGRGWPETFIARKLLGMKKNLRSNYND